MKKKTLALILTLCMTVTGVVCFAAGAAAAGGLQEIKAYLNADISLKMDGEERVLKDASGVRTYPITYNDTTYLPVRSIAELLGVNVGWDQATQSVLLGKQPSGVDLIDTYDIYYEEVKFTSFGQVRTSEGKTEDIAGVPYSNWIYLDAGYWNGNPMITNSISYNLLGKHDTLTFSCYSTVDTTFKILGDDGLELGEYSIKGGAVPKTFTVPLFHTNELKFQVDTMRNTKLWIMDAYLDAEQ